MQPRISKTTAETFGAMARTMGKTGAVPRSEANAVEAVLREASRAPKPGDVAGPKKPNGLLTTKQVANRFGCSSRTVFRMADGGQLTKRYLRPGIAKSLRFLETEVSAFCAVDISGEA